MAHANNSERKPLPTHEEIDAMVLKEFPEVNGQCSALCNEFQNISDEMDNPQITPAQRRKLLLLMSAISSRMRSMHCPQCLLQ